MLSDPEVLLLDEATSNLDAESEYMVNNAINALSKGKTTIVVAHKLNSIVTADQIIVFDKGRVAGAGNHDSLMKTCNIYKKLVEIKTAEMRSHREVTV